MSNATGEPRIRGRWIEDDARRRLGILGPHATIYNVYSIGDSGEGCEVIEFTVRTGRGVVAWTARVTFRDGRAITACTVGW